MVPGKTSIIIPTLNNVGMLSECIAAIRETCNDLEYEIIIACNAATKSTIMYLEGLGVKHVAFDTNKGFGAANNAAVKISTGEYLCFLNDDTLPAANWLKNMIYAMNNMCKQHNMAECEKVGAVGPLSNYIAGMQQIQDCNVPLAPQTRHAVARALERKYGISHFLSGMCYLIRREVFDEVGGWDERFFAGAEDNAISTRLLDKGYHLAVCGDAYVYHYGSRTIGKDEFKHLKGGVANVPDYVRWYGKPYGEKKVQLATVYRVKIQNDYILDIFLRSLNRTAEFSDIICILDDGTDHKFGLAAKIRALQESDEDIAIIYKHCERDFEERRDRRELLQMAIDAGADWVLSLDADEIIEDKVTYDYMHRLLNPVIPHTFGYYLHEYTFWNNETHWRVDNVWGKMTGHRLWRVQPNRSIFSGSKSSLHCEHVPILPPGCVAMTSIRIKHYGYVHAAERQRKFTWYEKVDTDKQVQWIGHSDYRHLIDESDLRTRPWVEKSSIGLTSIMKNERINLAQYIEMYWAFVDQIILVDTGSEDGSPEFAEWAGITVLKSPWNHDFATPRNVGVEACKEDWILQSDLDERIDQLSFVRRMLDYPTAACYMFYVRNLVKNQERTALSETIRLFRNGLGIKYEGIIHETVDDVIKQLGIRIHRSMVDMVHLGYLEDDEKLKRKMQYYLALCEKELENNPKKAKAWYNVAMHYLEVPELQATSTEYFLKSVELMPSFYPAYKELALLRLRQAGDIAAEMKKLIPEEHEEYKAVEELQTRIAPYAKQQHGIPLHVREYLEKAGRLNELGNRKANPTAQPEDQTQDRAHSPTTV